MRYFPQIVAVITLLCVVMVFIVPDVDLSDTSLRAKQIANSLLAVLSALLVFEGLRAAARSGAPSAFTVPRPDSLSHSYLCTFLC